MPNNLGVTLANMFQSFTGGTPAPAAPPATNFAGTNNPGNMPANPSVVAAPGNPSAPANPAPAANEPISPDAAFQKLWDTDPNAKPVTPKPLFTVNPEDFAKAAAKVDFKSVITPEVMARVKAGGEDGTVAMMEAMNSMSQTVYAQSAAAAARIAEEGIKKAAQQHAARLPELIKRQNVKASLQENPALSNPAFAPMVAFATSQIQLKNPTAPESQIRTMVSDYFDAMATVITDQATASEVKNNPPKVDKGSDFSNW